MKEKILFLLAIISFPIGMMAQITYSGGNLSINNAPKHQYLGLTIDKWAGMYWTCKTSNFFQLDLSPANPRLAGTGNQVVFYNTKTSTFNSIQVANVYNYSDARAKENVQSLTTGLNTILQLRPVTYNWKISSSKDVATTSTTTSVANGPAEDDQQQYGFLAQEVESVLPDAVKTDEEGHKMINYIAIIPMLVQAVQELQATVETQANMLSMIKNQGDIDAVSRLSKNRIVSCTPNPTSGNVEIKTEIDGEAKMPTLLISTLTGTREATLSVNSASVTYNASNLKAGIYIVSLYVDSKLVDSTRLIKE